MEKVVISSIPSSMDKSLNETIFGTFLNGQICIILSDEAVIPSLLALDGLRP